MKDNIKSVEGTNQQGIITNGFYHLDNVTIRFDFESRRFTVREKYKDVKSALADLDQRSPDLANKLRNIALEYL